MKALKNNKIGLELFFLNIAHNNPKGTRTILRESGYTYQPKSTPEAARMLSDIVEKEKEAGLKKLGLIHPDKELIIYALKNMDEQTNKKDENFNAIGPSSFLTEKMMNKLIVVGAGVVALGLITVIVTSKN